MLFEPSISDLNNSNTPNSRSTTSMTIIHENNSTNELSNTNENNSANELSDPNMIIHILNPFFFVNAQELTKYIDEVYNTMYHDIIIKKMYVHSSNDEDKKKRKKYIAVFVFFNFVLLSSIIFEIIGNITYRYKAIQWAKFGISLFVVAVFIYYTSSSILFLFTYFDRVKKHKYVYYLWIATITLICIMSLAPFFLLLVFSAPRKINYKNLTIGNPASFCSIDYYGLDLVQYAGLAALGHSTSETNAKEIVKLLFSDTSTFKNISIYLNETKYGHTFQIRLNESLSVVAINSLIDLQDYAFVLENYMTDVLARKVMGLIPMFETLFNTFLIEIVNFLAEFAYTFNTNLASTSFSEFIYNSYENIIKQNITTIYTGYSAGGILAKTLGIEYNVPSIAFNSLQTYYSTFFTCIIYMLVVKNYKKQSIEDL